ncbi:MAG TPA: hypothetical protein VI072_19995 [Polyangiaceae bacterium]
MRDGFRWLGRVALAIVILVIAAATNLGQSRATHGVTGVVLAAHDCADVERHAFVPRGFDVKAVECDAEDTEPGGQSEPSGAATLVGKVLLPSRKAERARVVAPLGFAASRVRTSAPLPRGPPA